MKTSLLSTLLLLLLYSVLLICSGVDRIQQGESLNFTQTITSAGNSFALGFFTPGNSTKHYLGIWYFKIKEQTVVWVANRENPLTDSTGFLTLSEDGNLKLLDGKNSVIWTSNVSVIDRKNITAVLSDNGNFVLRTTIYQTIAWQSFDYPIGSLVSGMKLSLNMKTGQSIRFLSWKDVDDPTPDSFSMGIDPQTPRQLVMWKGTQRWMRGDVWSAQVTSKQFQLPQNFVWYVWYMTILPSNDEISIVLSTSENSIITRYVLGPIGQVELQSWNEVSQKWDSLLKLTDNNCIYGSCGPFASCDYSSLTTVCNCLKGFQPKYQQDWEKGNWSGGCVRKMNLDCGKGDGFLRLEQMKLPDYSISLGNISVEACASECQKNCSCIAYSYTNVSVWATWNCLIWVGDLIDLGENIPNNKDLNIRLAGSELGENNRAIESFKKRKHLSKIVMALLSLVAPGMIALGCYCNRLRKKGGKQTNHEIELLDDSSTLDFRNENIELPLFTFGSIVAATNNFSSTNKLGQGGFGAVYKGNLHQGLQVAVKRLSKNSVQGLEEFRNEVQLIAKLQHKNLVRLLGWCIQGEEKILIYEFMPNKSLDKILFDPTQQSLLDWNKRFHIVQGIAQGIHYLHHYSRLKVIHRDLKASNILLDDTNTPKISDFGLARIFSGNQTEANTNRVMGTYGYMSPEYAMDGIFSEKSDVYSFGVLVIEIVSGKKINGFYLSQNSISLLGYAWELWNENRGMALIDSSMAGSIVPTEAMKCIQVGLLCVQEDPADRPSMSSIVSMLGNETIALPSPRQPAFPIIRYNVLSRHEVSSSSLNMVTISELEPR